MFTVTRVDVFNIQIEQSSCTIFGQKQFIRFTKLLLPRTSVHAYSPEQSPIVFLQLLYKFSRLALNIKSELFTLYYFLECLLLETSDRNADLD